MKCSKLVSFMCASFLLVGCSSGTANVETTTVEEKKGVVPGTYYGVGEGRNGKIVVEVTVGESSIEKIKVLSEEETYNTGSVVVETYPQLMVDNQTTNVDNVSGATISSMAFKTAVRDALTQAGVSDDAYKDSVSTTLSAEDTEADVVVIGAGGAGMTAAINAAENGSKVILVEKLDIVGGTSNYSIEGFGAVGDKTHAGLGSDATSETVAKSLTKSNPNGKAEAYEILASHNGEAADWLRSIGAELTVAGGQTSVASSREVGELGVTIVSALKAECNKQGVDVRTGTKAEEILTEDGKVTGVKVSNDSGEYTIACKSVVIATGGFGSNSEMVAKYQETLKGYDHSCSVGNTGDGQEMAEKLGASLENMDYVRVNFTYTTNDKGYYYYMGSLFNTGAIFVNNDGQRFVNDQGAYGVGMKVVEQGGEGWAIFDSSIVNGVADVRHYEKLGLFVEADTIEELAEKTGISKENLTATIEKYKEYVANGKDEEFNRGMLNMTFDEAPYYACKMSARVQGTFGGIATNTDTAVVDSEGNVVVAGLYAAGECASVGVYGANPAATNIVFGKIAGNNAAMFATENK